MTSWQSLQFAPNIKEFYVFNADYLFDDLKDAKAKLDGEQGDLLKKAADDKIWASKWLLSLEAQEGYSGIM